MKYMFQAMIIGIMTLIGEVLAYILPLPVPASIYGIVLLFLALSLGIIKLSQIEETADFLLAIMPLLFIAPTVGLMETVFQFGSSLAAILVVTLISTVIVMAATGLTAQWLIRRGGPKS